MNTSRFLKLAFCVCITLLISACSGVTVRNATAENDKDPSFSFDGRYGLIVSHPGGRQELTGSWYANCGPRDFRIPFDVKDSQVSIALGEDGTLSGFVDRGGRFRVTSELDDKVNVIGGAASNDSISIVVQGVLEKDVLKGTLVYAQAEHVGRGCTYPITYEYLGA